MKVQLAPSAGSKTIALALMHSKPYQQPCTSFVQAVSSKIKPTGEAMHPALVEILDGGENTMIDPGEIDLDLLDTANSQELHVTDLPTSINSSSSQDGLLEEKTAYIQNTFDVAIPMALDSRSGNIGTTRKHATAKGVVKDEKFICDTEPAFNKTKMDIPKSRLQNEDETMAPNSAASTTYFSASENLAPQTEVPAIIFPEGEILRAQDPAKHVSPTFLPLTSGDALHSPPNRKRGTKFKKRNRDKPLQKRVEIAAVRQLPAPQSALQTQTLMPGSIQCTLVPPTIPTESKATLAPTKKSPDSKTVPQPSSVSGHPIRLGNCGDQTPSVENSITKAAPLNMEECSTDRGTETRVNLNQEESIGRQPATRGDGKEIVEQASEGPPKVKFDSSPVKDKARNPLRYHLQPNAPDFVPRKHNELYRMATSATQAVHGTRSNLNLSLSAGGFHPKLDRRREAHSDPGTGLKALQDQWIADHNEQIITPNRSPLTRSRANPLGAPGDGRGIVARGRDLSDYRSRTQH